MCLEFSAVTNSYVERYNLSLSIGVKQLNWVIKPCNAFRKSNELKEPITN